jgi:hypothetical protein
VKKLTARQVLWSVALAVLAIGLLAAARALHDLAASRAGFASTLAEFKRLGTVEADLAGYLAARAAYEALPSPRAQDPGEALRRVLPGTRVDGSKEERAEAAPGWVRRRREYVFGAVPFGKVMEFVAAAEAQRPPWRLVRCTLRATTPQGGTGQAAIVLEALEKSGGAGP